MRCSRATAAMLDRELGRIDSVRATSLAAHLDGCPDCRRELTGASRLTAELAGLRGEFPFEINVRPRVLARLAEMQASPVEEVTTRQLGWAALAAGIVAVMIVAGFVELLPDLARAGRGLLVVASSLGELGVRLLQALGTLLAVPFKLVWSLFKWSAPLFDGLQPLAVGTVAACTAAMAATIATVLGRDLRRPHPLMTREDF